MNIENELNPISLRPTVMEVNLEALTNNYKQIAALVAPSKVMAVVKANAYGHGLIACGKTLVKAGASYLGVAFVEEGIELRQAGITEPILVFGGIFGDQIKAYLDYDLELTASSVSKLRAINDTAKECGKTARVHLKIDTGMERIGVHYYSCGELLKEATKCTHCIIVGIFSHFATADEPSLDITKEQLSRFLTCVEQLKQLGINPMRHIANSAGLLRLPESRLDMVRAGISLYGVYPDSALSKTLPLTPVMTLRSKVVYFKVVKKGAGVSYGHTWKAPHDTRVVTVPIGYGDGFFRRLSNRGSVIIRGNRYPIIGNICMDQIMVDIGPDGVAYNGDEVILTGSEGNTAITVNEVAKLAETIPYEILTSTNLRVPRLYKY